MKKMIFALLVLATFVGCGMPGVQPPQTSITVSSSSDAGLGSLRQALAEIADGGTIDLRGINNQTVTLLSTLVINKNLSITNTASGPNVVLQGGVTAFVLGNVRILEIQAGKTVTLSTLTLRNGSSTGAPAMGGAILNAGTLTLNNVTLSNNQAVGSVGAAGAAGGIAQGGAIYSSGKLTLNNVTLNGNNALGGRGGHGQTPSATSGGVGGLAQGGALFIATGGTLTINTLTLNANTATGGDGGNGTVSGPQGQGATASGGGAFKATGTTVTFTAMTTTANTVAAGTNGTGSFSVAAPPVVTFPNTNF